MRTIETTVYSFNELSEQAKEVAVKEVRNRGIDTDFIYDDALNTVKKFHDIFETKQVRNSWLDVYTDHIDDNIMNLKGLRLRTYIINNFGKYLYNGKYYSLWSKKDVSYKYHKEGYPVLKSRYSKVFFNNDCVLTGVCYDHSLLQPVYEFLDWKQDYSEMDFYTLMNDCFNSLRSDIEEEVDYRHSDEAIIETIEANNYEFTEEGKLI